jgi:2-polyprenyl-6-methoxyphenol hydroxylase-like FAD-dependent oxidoreductase
VVQEFGVPIDVLWTRIPKGPSVGMQTLGHFGAGKFMVLIDRGDYYQCGLVIPKGQFEAIKERGIEALRADIVGLAPFLRDQVGALASWDEVKLLTVRIDRLRRWYRPGLLCIGDSAHAMSPAGGVGINLAIQDAVAAANILAMALRQGEVGLEDLHRVQARRELPTRLYQSIQVFIHNQLFVPGGAKPGGPRGGARLMARLVRPLRGLPLLRRIVARVIGLGFRPEHIETPELPRA